MSRNFSGDVNPSVSSIRTLFQLWNFSCIWNTLKVQFFTASGSWLQELLFGPDNWITESFEKRPPGHIIRSSHERGRPIYLSERRMSFIPYFCFAFVVNFCPEYRAELYWRLESKRMKALSKENQPLQNSSSDQNNNIENENTELSGEVGRIIEPNRAYIARTRELTRYGRPQSSNECVTLRTKFAIFF